MIPLLLLLFTLASSSLGITLPGTGSNVDVAMQASPRVNFTKLASSSSLIKGMATIHDDFGSYLAQQSIKLGCEFPSLGAILRIESGGAGGFPRRRR